jgi:hypothetical protein
MGAAGFARKQRGGRSYQDYDGPTGH